MLMLDLLTVASMASVHLYGWFCLVCRYLHTSQIQYCTHLVENINVCVCVCMEAYARCMRAHVRRFVSFTFIACPGPNDCLRPPRPKGERVREREQEREREREREFSSVCVRERERARAIENFQVQGRKVTCAGARLQHRRAPDGIRWHGAWRSGLRYGWRSHCRCRW